MQNTVLKAVVNRIKELTGNTGFTYDYSIDAGYNGITNYKTRYTVYANFMATTEQLNAVRAEFMANTGWKNDRLVVIHDVV